MARNDKRLAFAALGAAVARSVKCGRRTTKARDNRENGATYPNLPSIAVRPVESRSPTDGGKRIMDGGFGTIVAQGVMLGTLFLMITGKTPLYLTAIIGASLSATIAGIPLTGEAPLTVAKLLVSGLNPVLVDMTGILLFIGVLKSTGYLDIVVRDVVRLGDRLGGGVGVAVAGGLAAGCIGALTGFTQPVVTAIVTAPAAVRLGVTPNRTAGIIAHAGHIGNLAGFTHPTQVAILATAGVGYGLFNVLGLVVGLSVFAASAWRASRALRLSGFSVDPAAHGAVLREIASRSPTDSSVRAFFPFLVLCAGFIAGLPVFLVGVLAAVVTMLLSGAPARKAEADMIRGVGLVATPLVATLGFLFLSNVIREIGLVDVLAGLVEPLVSAAPVAVMFAVACVTAFVTQSYGASVAVVVPFLQIVLEAGADPFDAAFAAASGAAIIQCFLTGGPVAALSTVVPVTPGAELKEANAFQRPSILFGTGVALAITMVLTPF